MKGIGYTARRVKKKARFLRGRGATEKGVPGAATKGGISGVFWGE
jgi:hypothetical protein